MPLVSVLMPCYNAEKTIHEALDSLTSQTLSDLEIIAVDDGSTDNTLQILQQHARIDNRIQIIHSEHGGIVQALNTGLKFCHAPYIARMDSDDRSHRERLAQQVSYFENHPDIGAVSCLVSAFPTNQIRPGFQIYIDWLNSLITDDQIRNEIFIESPLPHPSVTYRKTSIFALGGYQDHGWPEDYDLWMRMYIAGVKFAKTPQFLLEWRDDKNRLTRIDPRYSLENFIRLKAHYLKSGPLANRDAVYIWGAGMTGRRISKHLAQARVPLTGFIDVDPKKIGRQLRGLPILSRYDLIKEWSKHNKPVLLSAVSARKARPQIKGYLTLIGLQEGIDWIFVA